MRSTRGVEAIGTALALRPLIFGIIFRLHRADIGAVFHIFDRLPSWCQCSIVNARTGVAKWAASGAIRRDRWIILMWACHWRCCHFLGG